MSRKLKWHDMISMKDDVNYYPSITITSLASRLAVLNPIEGEFTEPETDWPTDQVKNHCSRLYYQTCTINSSLPFYVELRFA